MIEYTIRRATGLKMSEKNGHIRIPLISVGGSEEHIDIYPDELPEDHNDLIDILKSELAPFHVWRACAVRISLLQLCILLCYYHYPVLSLPYLD